MSEAHVPGVSLRELLHELNSDEVAELVSEEVQQVFSRLHPGTTDSYDFLDHLAESLPLQRVLKDQKTRRMLLRRLPKEKREELNERFGFSVPMEGSIELGNDQQTVDSLMRFFGGFASVAFEDANGPDEMEILPDYPLFMHQLDAAIRTDAALQSSRNIFPRCLLHMPTGSGKTRTACHIVSNYLSQNPDAVVVWLANSKELLQQASDEIQRAWKHLGNRKVQISKYWGNTSRLKVPSDGFVIAGLQKLYNLISRDTEQVLDLASKVCLVVVDEAHISVASTYKFVIDQLVHEPDTRLIGLTATPGRTWADLSADNELSEMFDNTKVSLRIVGYESSVRALIDLGYLADPTFRKLNIQNNSQVDNQDSEDDQDYGTELIEQITNNVSYLHATVEAVLELSLRHSRIMVFAASIKQAEAINLLLRSVGVDSYFVSGETPSGERNEIVHSFRKRAEDIRVIVNFGVLTTGFDAPNASAAIIARPTKSLVLFSQMVGRVIRGPKAGGNQKAEIVTVVDLSLPGFDSVTNAFENWEDVWTQE